MRAGAYGLSLLADPLDIEILQGLQDGPCSLIELRRAVGSPPQTTMRKHLRTLVELGILERRRQDNFPGSVDYELVTAGRELLGVARALGAWLATSPDGPRMLGSLAAKSTVKALIDGWSTNMLRALAAKPLSLTDLDALISAVSYPSIERRLAALRLTGQITRAPSRGRSAPYAVTDWLRRAVAPLGAAVRWEQNHLCEAPSIRKTDAETVFLLAIPLARLSNVTAGVCSLIVEGPVADGGTLVAASVSVDEGRVVACASRPSRSPAASISGSVDAWLEAVGIADPTRLEVSGDSRLANELLGGIHRELFDGLNRPSEQPQPV